MTPTESVMNPFLLPAPIHGLSSKFGFRYHLPGPLSNVILDWRIFISKSYYACCFLLCGFLEMPSIVPRLWRTGWSYRTIDVCCLYLFGKVLHVLITFELVKACHLAVSSFRQCGFRFYLSKGYCRKTLLGCCLWYFEGIWQRLTSWLLPQVDRLWCSGTCFALI